VTTPASPEEELSSKRQTFFKLLFGSEVDGYICIAFASKQAGWREEFYHYPAELPRMVASIERNYRLANAYFCPQLLKDNVIPPGRKSARYKENVKVCTAAWADLDACKPELLLVQPSIVMMSSADRYQALWVFKEPQDPEVAEQISLNIAYHHVPDGADSGGWDLTQYLRIPYTYNLKPERGSAQVLVTSASRTTYRVEDFSGYVEARRSRYKAEPMPEITSVEAPLDTLQRYRRSLNPVVFSIFSVEPNVSKEDGGWSKVLWQLEMLCFEAGMTREEVFTIASNAACNKYKRDGRHPRLLWEEVCRAHAVTAEKLNVLIAEDERKVDLLTDEELASVEEDETFVERYIDWASSLGDAAQQYHQAGAFVILSALLSGSVRLPTSFGTIMPNLWFMLLGDTTLTRKTTAMDTAMEMLYEVGEDALLATDGSLEGLMQALESRPGVPSVFLRDEFSGLIEAMARKDYMAGMAEALTKLYDGKPMKRILKRETIYVREPCLLIFGGGIKTRVQSQLTLDHVASGFMPRFVFITAESDVTRLQPLGPPTDINHESRSALIEELSHMRKRYVFDQEIIHQGKVIAREPRKIQVKLTPEAWDRYNLFETTMLYTGVNSDQPDVMTPIYDRMSKSTLKAAMLIATSRNIYDDHVIVDVGDIIHAIRYCVGWRDYAHEIINGIGRSASEHEMQRIFQSIRRHPGVSRAKLMQWYHLDARRAEIIFGTLEQRGMITKTQMGRTWLFEPVRREVK
jgi:uncharacterized protein DUF3987